MIPLLYSLIAGSSDLVGGWLAWRGRTAKIEPRYAIAFAAGVLMAVAFFDILPEVHWEADALWVGLGFFVFYLLEKVTMLHACGERECETHQLGSIAVVGMALDNFVDGAGIAVGFLIDASLGWAITVAVLLHEIPQGFTSALIMKEANWQRRRIFLILALASALYPLGAVLAGFVPAQLLQKVLAFIAGDFIYIGASDLLPQAHQRFNLRVILTVFLGMALSWGLKLLVPFA